MKHACILVHGYCGATTDLTPLAEAMTHPDIRVDNIALPAHVANGPPPEFDEQGCLRSLAASLDDHQAASRDFVLLGHSTGGNLILTELLKRQRMAPDSLTGLRLLILCATPPRVDTGYALRWGEHMSARGEWAPALHDIGALAAMVNRTARHVSLNLGVPVLIVQGTDDNLVPLSESETWLNQFRSPARLSTIAGGNHHLFTQAGAEQAIELVTRAVADAFQRTSASSLADLAPGLGAFVAAWPDRCRHLIYSPAGQRALGEEYSPAPACDIEPTIANIEITTRCTLACRACARTRLKLKSRHMSATTFKAVLAALPNAWRVNLVGLGEPLLHPEVLAFIRLAVAAGRRVSLVTNAMQLDANMAKELCESGLSGITFSLDALDPVLAEDARQGSDMTLILNNIRGFMLERKRHSVRPGAAIFTALGADSIEALGAVLAFASEQAVDAVMLSDLNFPANQARSLHVGLTPEQAGELRRLLRQAAKHRLPVLTVRGLEEYALDQRFADYLALRGEQLAERSNLRRHCLSPWQTAPVNVDGHASICDCQPQADLGDITRATLRKWWNGETMSEHRRCMLSDNPPADCLACPRF